MVAMTRSGAVLATTIAVVSAASTDAALARLEPSAASARQPQQTTVTYNEDIAPIVAESCATCHRPDGAGPFSLITYEDVRKRAGQIARVTAARFMPPWKPEPGYGTFVG